MNDTVVYWIWLSLVCGYDTGIPVKLLLSFQKDISAVYHADKTAYEALGYLKESQITALCDKDLRRPNRILDACQRLNIGILPLASRHYPARLKRIYNPPTVLYYRGRLPDFDNYLSVAVVGTRSMTDTGRRNTYRVAYELSVAGANIVSGMALGIDGIAQKAALDAGGNSIAVLGTAIDRCYPQEHRPLYDRLLAYGCILSEYGPGTETKKWNFPQRNRIISGLCQATVIAEAGKNSGALITADCCLSQGRELYAMPGNSYDPDSEGTNALIKNGVRTLTEAADILNHFKPLYEDVLFPEKLSNPGYFAQYDDTLLYGAQTIRSRRERKQPLPEHPFRPEAPQTPVNKSAPRQNRLREEVLTVPEPQAETVAVASPAQKPELPVTEPFLAADKAVKQENSPSASGTEAAASTPTIPENSITAKSGAYDIAAFSEYEQKTVSLLKEKHRTTDELCNAGIPIDALMTTLTVLEMHGYVRALPGGYYEYIK